MLMALVETAAPHADAFTTTNHSDYRLIRGLHNRGARSVDDIRITRNG
jgi:hypothetical protein